MSWICNPVAPAFVLADFYPPFSFVKFIGYVRAGPAAFRVGPVRQMEGIRFHLCASPLFHACAEGLAVADEFHVPQSFRLAAAMRFQVSRCHIAARLQLRLADGKSLLCKAAGYRAGCGLRAREACPSFFASRAAVPHPLAAGWCQGGGHSLWGGEHRRRLSSRVTATVKSTARTNEKNSVRSLYVNT